MTTSTAKGHTRSGATALDLLAAPLKLQILRGLEQGPESLVDLRKGIGSPPQSTMRNYVATLVDAKALERTPQPRVQGSVEFALTRPGSDLLAVAVGLQRWLDGSPGGRIELGTPPARGAVKVLGDAWSSNIVRALAAQPLSLTELARLIPRISYPALERRLTSMRLLGLVEPRKEEGRATPYHLTGWLRRAVVVLTSASEWEREYIPDTTPPIGRLDVEAAFLLAVSLMRLPPDLSGRVRLAVEIQRGASPVFAGVLVCVEDGEVTACTPGVDGEAEGWVSGAPRSWLRRMNRREDGDHLEMGGTSEVARAVLDALSRPASGTREVPPSS
jgi:DNA-binding HxlR family transcriptional regulator